MQSSASRFNTALETQVKVKYHPASLLISRKNQGRLLILCLIVSDLLMAGIAFWAAYFIRFQTSIQLFRLDVTPSLVFYKSLFLGVIPLWLAIFAIVGLYNRSNLMDGMREYSLVFNAVTIGMFTLLAAGWLLPDFIFARGWLLSAWILAILSIELGRFGVRRLVSALRERGFFVSPAIIVGGNEEGCSLAEQLSNWKSSGLDLVGFVDSNIASGTQVYSQLRALGGLDQLDTIIAQHNIEEVVLTTSALTRDQIVSVFMKYGVSKEISLRLSSGLFEIITTGLQVHAAGSVPLVRVDKNRLTGVERTLKLLLDYFIAIPGLILVSPFMVLIAVAIRLDSPGPVIHRRTVMGVNGHKFDAYKFRTMVVNGDEILSQYPHLRQELEENHKLVTDPRITRVGAFLRRTSLDELPQLFNVLRREMSLVGPRMISPPEMAKYNRWGMNLLTVQPGITGLWQVSGRSDVSYDERVRLDMQYIRNWSIWLDLQLLLQTIPAVVKGRGAY